MALVSLYAPSGRAYRDERTTFFRQLVPAFLSAVKLPLILMGDFNAVDDVTDRIRLSGTRPSTPVDHALGALTAGLELVDVWKALRPRDLGHTYFHQGGSARIDRIYCSRSIKEDFSLITVSATSVTDHSVVHCLCHITNSAPCSPRKSPSVWKLNVQILEEEAFKARFHRFWSHATRLPLFSGDLAGWWETIFKPGVRRIAQGYCRHRAALHRSTRNFFQQCLSEMAEADTNWTDFRQLRDDMREWDARSLAGAKIRARCNSVADVDEPSIFHLQQEASNGRKSTISSLLGPDGSMITDPVIINDRVIT